MRRRRSRNAMHLNAEINVVSLIDVMMLLLVIFMLTAPMMTSGLDIRLPEADAKPIESNGGLTVTIDKSGRIFLGDASMSLATFRASFKSVSSRSKEKSVKLQMDGEATADMLAPVMTIINQAGINDVGFVFNPLTKPPTQ